MNNYIFLIYNKMDKKYTDKFIPLKDIEVNVLSNLKKDSTFEPLKKVLEMKKVLDTINEIYKIKISPKSLRYLSIVSKVRKFQLNAFKDLPEIKKLLAKNIKEKLKSKKGGRAMKGKAPKDIVDKVIADSSIKKEDPLGKLLRDVIKSKDTSDLQKAIKDYANIFCQSGIQNLIKTNSIGKVFTDLFTVIKRNVNNLVFQGKIGFDNSGWNASKEFMNLLTTALTCLTQIKPIFDFFKNLFRRAFRVVTAPFRRGDRPPNPTGGRGDGPDDDDNGQPPPPQQPPSSQQRNRLNELFNQQQSNIESNIGSAGGFTSSTFGPQGGPPQPQGPPQGPQGPQGDDLPSGPSDESGAGAIAIQFGGESQPRRNQFGAGIPSGNPENTPWDPFNFASTAAFLAGINTYFNPPRKEADIEPPESSIATAGGYISFNPQAQPQPPPPPMDIAPPGDDGLGFEDDFQRERFEMDEAERARQEAEQEDEEMDRKLPAIEPPESSVAVAGSLFTGGKAIMASSFDAVRAAQLASKIFDQMAGAVNQVETIDESLELKETIAGQQIIEGDIQQNLISQMVEQPSESVLSKEVMLVDELVQDGLAIMDSIDEGQMSLSEGQELLNSILEYITNILSEIPKESNDSDDISRLKNSRAAILDSIERLKSAKSLVTESFDDEYEQLLKGYETGLTLNSLQSQILPNIQDTVRENLRVERENEKRESRINRENEVLRAQERLVTQQQTLRDRRQRIQQESRARQGIRTLTQRLADSELGREISQRPMTISPILVGLPLPLRDTQQGGALRPSRETSLENLTERSLMRRRPPSVYREQARNEARQVVGVGAPTKIFARITGNPDATVSQTELIIIRLGERFGFDGKKLFSDFKNRFGRFLYQNNNKFYKEGRQKLEDLLLDKVRELNINIRDFYLP